MCQCGTLYLDNVARCTWIIRILIQLVRWLSLQLVHEWRRVRCVGWGTWVRCVHFTVCTVGQMGTCVVVLLCGVHVPPCAVDTTVTLSRNLHCVNRCANVPAATCCYVLLLLLYPHHMRHMRHMPLQCPHQTIQLCNAFHMPSRRCDVIGSHDCTRAEHVPLHYCSARRIHPSQPRTLNSSPGPTGASAILVCTASRI